MAGYVGNRTIAFNGTSALWTVPNLPPGAYNFSILLFDSKQGIIQDSEMLNITVLPTAEISDGAVLVTPRHVGVGMANVTIESRFKVAANIKSNLSLSYTLTSPAGDTLISEGLSTAVRPFERFLTVPLATITHNFSESDRYTIAVNATINSSTEIFSSYIHVLPEVKLSAEKTVSPGELLPGNQRLNFSISINGEGRVPNVTQKTEAMLVIDRSGSMAFTDYPPTRLDAATNASREFVDKMLRNNYSRIGVVSFTGHECTDWFFGCWSWRWDITLDTPLTANKSEIFFGLDSLRADGPTAIGMGIYKARDHLVKEGELTARKFMVLLSDGKDSGRYCHWLSGCTWVGSPPSHFPLLEAKRARNESITIYTVAIGNRSSEEFNETLLRRIANITGGEYYYAPTSENLNQIYHQIATEIAEPLAGRDIVVRDTLPRNSEPIPGSFSPPPANISTGDNGTVVEWHVDKLGVGEELNLSFSTLASGLGAGNRTVNSKVNITYLNVNGEHVTLTLPGTSVKVLLTEMELNTSVAKMDYLPHENVSVEVRVSNTGETTRNFTLRAGIYDEQNNLVHGFSPVNQTIAANETQSFNFTWNTGNTYAGEYRATATLDVGLGSSARFEILPRIALESTLYSTRLEYAGGEQANFLATIESLSPNFAFKALRARLTVRQENGSTAYTQEKIIPQLLPLSSTTLNYYWNTSRAPPGNYSARLEVYHNGTVIDRGNASFAILSSFTAHRGLGGTLNVSPRELRHPAKVNFSYKATNTGNVELDNLSLAISLASPSKQAMIHNFTANTSLAMGESANGTFTEYLALPREDYLVLFYGVYNSTVIPIDEGYLRVLATPRSLKKDSIALLATVNTGEEHAGKEIARAVESIEESLGSEDEREHHGRHDWHEEEEPLWLDNYTLSPEEGQEVFNEEKKAVKHLLRACSQEERHDEEEGHSRGRGMHGHDDGERGEDEKASELKCSFNSTARAVIDNLLLADEVLANHSIREAELELANASDEERAQREIDRAYNEHNKAYSAIAEERYAKAIDRFKLTWGHAQLALKALEEKEEHDGEHGGMRHD